MKTIFKYLFIILFFQNLNTAAFSNDVSKGFSKLAEKSMPSVVNISATTIVETRSQPFPFQFPPGSPFEDFFKEFEQNQGPQKRRSTALGSGFVIKEDGTVITNNHVIQNAEGIIVRFTNGKEYEAEILGTDPMSDVAVLKIKSNAKFPAVNLADSDKAKVGDWVLAIGNPFGLGGTVTQGIISAINRDINMGRYDNFIQTDASINQGNSGGPLFNMDGDVIGINTAIFSNSGGSVGIGFAIPSNFAKNVIDQLIKFGETKRGWLGVRIQEVTKEIADVEKLKNTEGALVASVGEKSPAEKAGLQPGDIILKFDGQKIDTMRTLPKLVSRTEVGKTVELEIWRDKKLITKKLTLGRLESSEDFKAENKPINPKKEESEIEVLKITVRDVSPQDIESRKLDKKTEGVVILEIGNKSPLTGLLQAGDIILEVQKNKVSSADDLNKQIESINKKGEQTLLLTIINNNNQRRYLGVKIN